MTSDEPRTSVDVMAVRTAIAAVPDPCMAFARLPLSVTDLGLLRDVRVEGGRVEVDLTFTELGCSWAHHLVEEVHAAVAAVDGVEDVEVRPVFGPLWSREDMQERARVVLADSVGRLSAIARERGFTLPTNDTLTRRSAGGPTQPCEQRSGSDPIQEPA